MNNKFKKISTLLTYKSRNRSKINQSNDFAVQCSMQLNLIISLGHQYIKIAITIATSALPVQAGS